MSWTYKRLIIARKTILVMYNLHTQKLCNANPVHNVKFDSYWTIKGRFMTKNSFITYDVYSRCRIVYVLRITFEKLTLFG